MGLLAAGWAAFVVLGSSWWQLLTAAYLAVVFTQLAFMGHDAGHRQLFRSRRAQQPGSPAAPQPLPPHTNTPPLPSPAAQPRSKHGLVRLIARYQGWLFFSLLLLEAAHLHLASIKSILQGSGRANTGEGLLLGARGG